MTTENKKQEPAKTANPMPEVDIKAGRQAYIKVCASKGIKAKDARRTYQATLRKKDKAIRKQIDKAAISSYRERVRKSDGKVSLAVFAVIG